MSITAGENSELLAHFTLRLTDGSIADSSAQQGKPALFRLGDNSLSGDLKRQLIGLKSGDKKRFTLPPHAAFGAVNPDLIQYFTTREFIGTDSPKPGTVMLFTAINGRQIPGIIREINGESVTVDFNHPLAGQTIQFDIEILAVNTPQESARAHPVS